MSIEDGCQKASASVETSCMKINDGSQKESGIDDSFSVIAANGDTLNVCYFYTNFFKLISKFK